jgi:type II restriction enzyme
MILQCDATLAAGYSSQAQIARILSERWLASYGYCLSCDCNRLSATAANTRATDFTCTNCDHRYELKAFKTRPSKTLVDGAYGAMMDRIRNGTVPTLMLLERSEDWKIEGLTAIHHVFLTPNVIAQRRPLAPTARRAGWVGCNIRLDQISTDAQITLIATGTPVDREIVRLAFRRFEPLNDIAPDSRGWTTLTLRIIRSLGLTGFSLGDLYKKEDVFAAAYPGNRNVRAKIRQQLQVLRDLGFLKFQGRGIYLLTI